MSGNQNTSGAPYVPLTLPAGVPLRSLAGPLTGEDVPSLSLNVVRGDVALPVLALKETALRNNLQVMSEISVERGFLLAPHGKTTMAPELFRMQLAVGAWGITVANVTQADVARWAGAERILIANEVVSQVDMRQLARWQTDGGPQVWCLVDSAEDVALLDGGLAEAGIAGQLLVLLEFGAQGGRCGVRTYEEAVVVARAAAAAGHLRLAGVEGYEGAVATDRSPAALARVDDYLESLRNITLRLADSGVFDAAERMIVSAGGSKYFDRVADILADAPWPSAEVDVVVRSGCYLTHDDGYYAAVSPLAEPDAQGRRLLPAIEVWAEVLSVPEPDRAIVGIGRRNVSYDLGLPVTLHTVSAAGEVVPAPEGLTVTGLDDQHAYLDGVAGRLKVGNLLGFGLSHPCTAFDKWRRVLLVDDDYTVLNEITTYF